ncbi:hypothetical protein TRFO_16165 [Tritrichomonas foetus]|uniref:Uncharacterized protein n=1 Tax=Tritrichomonas foetus TaxID=1144522 RepID=A0A1J4KV46_9EUKA|nr:hypothetical protein TRFO_16165 [Tritrichomonas foetus]|eukprot:OHT13620.1 hypothetical protein TRFO_16165 [Tritrichomonas foetus]
MRIYAFKKWLISSPFIFFSRQIYIRFFSLLPHQMLHQDEQITCKRCYELQHEFEILQEKEEKLRNKLKSLEEQVHDLQLKNSLLEEENKFLKAAQIPKKEEIKTDDNSKKVVAVLNDFDDLFESQGSQISHLIEDREKLVILSFTAISLLSKQEATINRFKVATQKLISYISQSGETATAAAKEFSFLGIDISKELDFLQRHFLITKVVSSAQGNIISDQEIIDIVNDLNKSPNDPKVIKNILNFVTSQIEEKENLRTQISKEEALKEASFTTVNKIISQLHVNRKKMKNEDKTQNYILTKNENNTISEETLEEAVIEIKKLRRAARNANEFLFVIHEMVNILTKFAGKHSNDANVHCCIKRLKRWQEYPESKINLCQEINFLLQSLNKMKTSEFLNLGYNDNLESNQNVNHENLNLKILKNENYDYRDDSSSVSVESLVQKIENERQQINNYQEIEDQIAELSETVTGLKNELNRIDSERKEFISKKLKGQISQNTSWQKICTYLLKRIRAHSH